MKEMYVAYLTEENGYRFLCIFDKKTEKHPTIVVDLDKSKYNLKLGIDKVTNPNYNLRKATEREIAEGLARRI